MLHLLQGQQDVEQVHDELQEIARKNPYLRILGVQIGILSLGFLVWIRRKL